MNLTKKSKILIASSSALIVIAGAAVAGWAVVEENQGAKLSIKEQIKIATTDKKIAPILSQKFDLYSSNWVEKYSVTSDFNFPAVGSLNGYNERLIYEVVGKRAVGNQLELDILVSDKFFVDAGKEQYSTFLSNVFSTPIESVKNISNQTVIDLQSYKRDIDVSVIPSIDTTVPASSIVIDSLDFKKSPTGTYTYSINGAVVKAIDTIDINSINNIGSFISSYEIINGKPLTVQEKNDITESIKFQTNSDQTVILFEVQANEGAVTNKIPCIIFKDFSNLNASNEIQNAPEVDIALNDAINPPTAQEVIDSINNNNPRKYLNFVNLDPNSKFIYSFESGRAKITEGHEVLGDSIDVVILISSSSNDVKRYTKTISSLQSIQEYNLNNLIETVSPSEWKFQPVISPDFTNKPIEEIINSFKTSIIFAQSDLDKQLAYDYIVKNPQVITSGNSKAIRLEVTIINKENSAATYMYPISITAGFVAST